MLSDVLYLVAFLLGPALGAMLALLVLFAVTLALRDGIARRGRRGT